MTRLSLDFRPAASPFLCPCSAADFYLRRSYNLRLPVLRRSLAVVAKSKNKELILGNPSVTVEKGKYSYDVETLINKLSSLPPRGSIARCLETFKSKVSLSDFSSVFKEFAQRGDWQRSLRLFKYMQRQIWCKPNEHIYSLIIGILGREGLLDKSAEIFDEMPANSVPRTVLSYTAIINAYGRNGQYETAIELLERMKRERVLPNYLTYNTVINACSRGGYPWEGLLSLFGDMRHEGVQPDLITYNTLLSACSHRKLGDEAEMIFRTMNDSGVLPDITTYRYLVETFGKLGKLEKVSELLGEMEVSGSLPEVTSYNVLLEAYAHSGSIKEAMAVFRQMQTAGCVPNAATYGILLNLFGKSGRYDEVRDLFLEMKVSDTDPDAGSYNILIQVFGEGGYFKEAVALFRDMVEENVEPNMETYEGLIRACGKGGLHEEATKILRHLNSKGLVPSSKVYTGVIESYGQAALYEEALVAFNTMNEVGSTPTIETFNSMVHSFSKGGLYKETESILARMNEFGISKNRDSLNGVIEGYRQAGQCENALTAYADMEKVGCDPDEYTLEAVLSVYSLAGLVDECEHQFAEIKDFGIQPSIICYCSLLSVYAKSNRWDRITELLDEMHTSRASTAHQIMGQMIRGDFDDDANWQMVEYAFDKLISEGCSFGIRFYNAILEALWCLGQRERAARVLREATKRGLYPELYRRNSNIWSVDVHRMSPGGACAAISIWLNDLWDTLARREEPPQLASVVVVRGFMEKNSSTRDFPVAKAAYSLLKDVSSSFGFSGWNRGRIVCQKSQLKRAFHKTKESPSPLTLSNDLFPPPGPGAKRTSFLPGLVRENSRNNSNPSNAELTASGL